MVAHALEDAPIECCGLLATKDGAVVDIRRAVNKEASPYRFSIDPLETRKHELAMDDAGQSLGGFYHSHTGSPAIPSPTDIRMMGTFFGPPYVHFVIGVADRARRGERRLWRRRGAGRPEVRVWFIENGDCTEQSYEVIGFFVAVKRQLIRVFRPLRHRPRGWPGL